MPDQPQHPEPTPTPGPEHKPKIEDTLSLGRALGDAELAANDSARAIPGPRGKSSLSADAPAWRLAIRRWRTIRDAPTSWEKAAFGLACIVVILLVWAFLTAGETSEERIVGPALLPSLGEMAASFPSLWFDRELTRSTAWSLGRVMGGFLLAAAFAVPLGVVAACYTRVGAFFRPPSIFGRNIPIAALIPLTLMWFGLGETQKVMFIFLSSVAFIFFDTTHAVDAVSNRFLDTAYTLGARAEPAWGARRAGIIGLVYGAIMTAGAVYFRMIEMGMSIDQALAESGPWVAGAGGLVTGFAIWFPIQAHQAIRKVLFPLALPDIVNSLRLLFGLAFGYIMLAEVINPKVGLGNIIIMSQRRGPREHIFLILIIISLLAFAIDRLVYWAQQRWFPYREHAES